MQGEVRNLKEQLALQEEARPSPGNDFGDLERAGAAPEAGIAVVDKLASRIHANVAERINQQKAISEVQDANMKTGRALEGLTARLQVRLRLCLYCINCVNSGSLLYIEPFVSTSAHVEPRVPMLDGHAHHSFFMMHQEKLGEKPLSRLRADHENY
jgi:hypothetical protein